MDKINKHLVLTVVLFIVIFQAVVNYIWLGRDTFPLWFDYGGYFKRSIDIYYASQNNAVDCIKAIFGIGKYAYAYHPHRLILPLFSLPGYYLFGLTADIAVMSCTIFLAISLFSIYGIASKIFNKTIGFLAAFILSVSPGFFAFYRRYSPEFAATAMVALAIYFLLRSKYFQDKKYSILSGIAFGLGMITKEMSFAFIAGIIAYSLYKMANKIREYSLNFSLFLFSLAITIAPLYWLHKQEIISNVFNVAYSEKIRQTFNMVNRFSFAGSMFYLKGMFYFGFLNFYFLFFIIGLVLFLKTKENYKGFILFWFVSSYVMLVSMQTKTMDYAIPLLIPMAIITAYGINNIFENRLSKVLLILFVIMYGLFELLVYSFPIFSSSRCRILNLDGYNNFLYPMKDDWKLAEIMNYLKENLYEYKGVVRIHVGANTSSFSPMTLAYVAAQKKIEAVFAGYSLKTEEVLFSDFVIVKSGQDQGMFYSSEQAQELVKALDKNGFIRLSKIFILPDGSEVAIYKNQNLSYLK